MGGSCSKHRRPATTKNNRHARVPLTDSTSHRLLAFLFHPTKSNHSHKTEERKWNSACVRVKKVKEKGKHEYADEDERGVSPPHRAIERIWRESEACADSEQGSRGTIREPE